MKIRVYGKNVEITKSIKALVMRKLAGPVERLLPTIDAKTSVPFDIEVQKRSVRNADTQWACEVNITVPGRHLPLRVRAIGASLDAAINKVKDGVERRIKKFKGKKEARVRRGARKAKQQMRKS